MNLATFEDNLGSEILKRGSTYYDNGHVASLEEEKGVWTAMVVGSDDYSVEVELNKAGVIMDCYCDCPYDGNICKHVVATLYAIREACSIVIEEKKPKQPKKRKLKLSFNGLLDKIDLEEIKGFIIHYSKSNEEFKSDFELYFVEKDEDSDLEGKLRKQIRNTVKAYTYRQFIDYRSVGELANNLYNVLHLGEDYYNKQNFMNASILAMVFIQEVMPVITYSDDSSGHIGGVISEGISLLENVALKAPYALKEKIIGFLNKELRNNLYFDYGDFGYDMVKLCAQLSLDLGTADSFLQFVDAALAKEEKAVYKYRLEFYTELKLSILTKLNRKYEADQLLEKQIYLPKMRRIKVEEVIANEDYTSAKKLLTEGIRLAEEQKHPGTVRQWEEYLLRIAELEKDIQSVRYYLEKFAFDRYLDESYYRELRSTYQGPEWRQVIEKKINSVKREIDNDKKYSQWVSKEYTELLKLGDVYVEEQMYSRLIALIQRQKNIDTVLQYHENLYKDYPNELMAVYSNLLDKSAEDSSNRKDYNGLMQKVLFIAKDIPSGQAMLKNKMQDWKEIYKRRPAMVNEITKALDKM